MKYRLLNVSALAGMGVLLAMPALAHVVVKPAEVGVAAFQTFTIGVPNEKDVPTVGLRLVIPSDLAYVSPTVKPGWKIEVVKSGEKVTEIRWTGGVIPAGMRDEFTFSAQVPAQPATVQWKAYQTYQGGQIVSWDQAGETKDAMQPNVGPYSETKVINDISGATSAVTDEMKGSDRTSFIISVAALAISVLALGMQKRKQS